MIKKRYLVLMLLCCVKGCCFPGYFKKGLASLSSGQDVFQRLNNRLTRMVKGCKVSENVSGLFPLAHSHSGHDFANVRLDWTSSEMTLTPLTWDQRFYSHVYVNFHRFIWFLRNYVQIIHVIICIQIHNVIRNLCKSSMTCLRNWKSICKTGDLTGDKSPTNLTLKQNKSCTCQENILAQFCTINDKKWRCKWFQDPFHFQSINEILFWIYIALFIYWLQLNNRSNIEEKKKTTESGACRYPIRKELD